MSSERSDARTYRSRAVLFLSKLMFSAGISAVFFWLVLNADLQSVSDLTLAGLASSAVAALSIIPWLSHDDVGPALWIAATMVTGYFAVACFILVRVASAMIRFGRRVSPER